MASLGIGVEAGRGPRPQALVYGTSVPAGGVLPARRRTSAATHVVRPLSPLSPFAPLLPAIRWGTLAVGVVLAAIQGPATVRVTAGALILLASALWQTFLPLDPRASDRRALLWVIGETELALMAVCATGYWDSPYVFSLFVAVVAAGFSRGFGLSFRIAGTAILAVGIPHYVLTAGSVFDRLQHGGQWAVELLLVAVLTGYARRVFGEAEARHSQAMNRMGHLVEANDLLVSLHRVAQTLPASLNLDDVVASTTARVREVIDCDVATVLLRNDATGTWSVSGVRGPRAGDVLTDDQLPPAVRSALTSSVASLAVVLEPGEGFGPDQLSHSGLYAPLRARQALVGLLVVEHHEPGRYGRRELVLLDQLLDPAALAIDNARWFNRLRTLGADEERIRIARDLHDRIGQSLASVGFALDRVARVAGTGSELGGQLDELRGDVRGVIGEVRDTLADLRTDVSDDRGLADTLEAFLERVGKRAALDIDFGTAGTGRLPVIQERELWRIAHEAITNAERHARAHRLEVWWQCDGRSAILTVTDDGEGFAVEAAGRADAYGVTGMRERADAIGAKLDIISSPGAGTRVSCRLEPPHRDNVRAA